MQKRFLSVILFLSLSVMLVTGSTLAWFTASTEPVTNEFTAGTVKITADDMVAAPEFMVKNWNPGDSTVKEFVVKNVGTKSIYIRGIIKGQWYENDGITPWAPSTDENVVTWIPMGDAFSQNWVRDGNTWYYIDVIPGSYTKPDQNDRLAKLALRVRLDGVKTGNEYQGKTFKLTVVFEAVQASHNAISEVWGLSADDFTVLSMQDNRQKLYQLLETLKMQNKLPATTSGTPDHNTGTVRDLIIESGLIFKNPLSGSELVLNTSQAGINSSSAVMVSQRDVTMQKAMDNQKSHLWPINAAESSKTKYVGTIVVQICKDGYLIYDYPAYGETRGFMTLPLLP